MSRGLAWEGQSLKEPGRNPERAGDQRSFGVESHPSAAFSSVLWVQTSLPPPGLVEGIGVRGRGGALVPLHPPATQSAKGWAEAGVSRQAGGWGGSVPFFSMHRETVQGFQLSQTRSGLPDGSSHDQQPQVKRACGFGSAHHWGNGNSALPLRSGKLLAAGGLCRARLQA